MAKKTEAFAVGERVTYFPIKKNVEDNRHWPAVVLSVGKRYYRVEVHKPGGVVTRSVSALRLARQGEITL